MLEWGNLLDGNFGVAGRVQSRYNHAIGALADILQTSVTWAYQKSVSSDNRSMRRELRGSMDRRWGDRLSRGWWATLVSSGRRGCWWRWTSLICRGCRACWAYTHCSLHPPAQLSVPGFGSAMKLPFTICLRQLAESLNHEGQSLLSAELQINIIREPLRSNFQRRL